MQTARDLMLLAAVAFNNGKYDDAGALFATALSSEDAPQLLERLGDMEFQPEAEPTVTAGATHMSLREISQALSAAIEDTMDDEEGVATASDDEDEEDLDEEEDEDDLDEEEDEGDDEEESDDFDPDNGGETILPSSISSVQVKRKEGGSKLIISGLNSPIKLKQ